MKIAHNKALVRMQTTLRFVCTVKKRTKFTTIGVGFSNQ